MSSYKDHLQFLTRKFKEKSDIDARKGSMVMDLAVRPTAIISKDTSDEIDDINRINNIDNYNSMTEEEFDLLMGKFFEDRVVGKKNYGVTTIYFPQAKSFFVGKESAIFSSINGIEFSPRQDYTVSAALLASQKTSDGQYYWWDIEIESKTIGTELEVGVGEITALTGIEFEFAYVSNRAPISIGSEGETNAEYYTRAQKAINDRSYYSRRSITARLKTNFPFVKNSIVIGPGNPRMSRDLVQAIAASEPKRSAGFFGKYPAGEFIPHKATYTTFPLEADNLNNLDIPLAAQTEEPIPVSILPREVDSPDAAMRGVDIESEFTHEMYKGIYRMDTRAFTRIETLPIYSALDAVIFGPYKPDDTWKIGQNGGIEGNYGTFDKSKLDYFEAAADRSMIFKAANLSTGLTIQKNINKRIGIMLTGSFTIPGTIEDDANNPLMFFLIGGVNDIQGGNEYLNLFSGYGFAIRKAFDSSPEYNNVYLVNNNKNSSLDFYASASDVGDEIGWALESGRTLLASGTEDVTVQFELVIHDDLTMTLVLWNDDGDESFSVKTTKLLAVEQDIMNQASANYGSDFKISMDYLPLALDEENPEQWIISDLLITDITRRKPIALFQFDVTEFANNLDVELNLRAYSIDKNDLITRGFNVYIWNTEHQVVDDPDPRINGIWDLVSELSVKDVASEEMQYVRTTLFNIGKYLFITDLSKLMYILVVPTGRSRAITRYSSGSEPQISQSYIEMDFIRLFDETFGMYHAKNKADLYVTTVRNNDNTNFTTETHTVDDQGIIDLSNSKLPILEITEVKIPDSSFILNPGDYTIVYEDQKLKYSAKEVIKIIAEDYAGQDLAVSYVYFTNVKEIQDFYDSESNQGTVGDVLVRHRTPFFLDFTINYSGAIEPIDLQIAINDWFDDNVDTEFEVFDLLSFINGLGVVDVQLPLTFNYERTMPDGKVITGSFTDRFTIDIFEFYRLRNVIYNRG